MKQVGRIVIALGAGLAIGAACDRSEPTGPGRVEARCNRALSVEPLQVADCVRRDGVIDALTARQGDSIVQVAVALRDVHSASRYLRPPERALMLELSHTEAPKSAALSNSIS
jgi:hypothetical protein